MKFWLIFVALFFSSSLWAAELSLLSFAIHSEAQVLYVSEKRLQNHRLALGTYRKINNRWQPDDSRRLPGKLKSQTLVLSGNHSAAEVFNFYHRQLLPQQTSTLFFCEARDCGSSNVWANNHFKIRQLYGLDQFQFYGVYQWRLKSDSPLHYVTLYTVRRGNGRIYAQIEVFLPDPTGQDNLVPTLSE